MWAPLKTGALTMHEAGERLHLPEQADAVLQLHAEAGQVLQERRAVDELDGGADAEGGGQGLRDQLVLDAVQGGRGAAGQGPAASARVEPEEVEELARDRVLEAAWGWGRRERRSRRSGSGRRSRPPWARCARRTRPCARPGRGRTGGSCRARPAPTPGWTRRRCPRVSVSGLVPCVFRAAATSSRVTSPLSTRTSPSCWPVAFCSSSASRSWLVVIFFIRMRMSPRRSRLRARVSSSSLRRAGAWAPELLLVGVAGRAEAAEAERAELGGVLGIVRAPDGALGVELAQAVPAGDVVGLDGAAPARLHAGHYLCDKSFRFNRIIARPRCRVVAWKSVPLRRQDCIWRPPPACARRPSTPSIGRAGRRWSRSAAGTCPSSTRG